MVATDSCAAPWRTRFARPAVALGTALAALSVLTAAPSRAQTRPEMLVSDPGAAEQAAVRAEHGDAFRVLTTDHFTVVSDTSLRYHTVVAGLLEQFHQLVQPRFFVTEMKPVRFYLIDGGDDFERFVRARGLPNASGFGLYEPRSRTLYARRYFPDGRESGVGTLFHEAVHAMMHADFGASPPPRWVSEGFASLFEVGRVVRGQWVYGNPNPWRETPFRAAFEAGRVPSLEALLATDDAAFESGEEQSALLYNAGRSLFLYVLRDHGQPALADFVRRLREGATATVALPASTGLGLAQIEAGWHESIRRRNYGGDYLYRGQGSGGLAVLEAGARLYPDYGNLQAIVAIEYMNRGDQARALTHARRALEDPHMILHQWAYFVIARSLLATDANAAAQALDTSIAFQPWNEQIFGHDYEMLAFMLEEIGQQELAARVRADLAELERLDSRTVKE